MTKRIFFDTKFTGLHQNTTLISLGMISECGRTFYAESTDYDRSQVDDWVMKHVITNLYLNTGYSGSIFKDINIKHMSHAIANYLGEWLNSFYEPLELWGDCLAYDWVLIKELMQKSIDYRGLPKNVYYIPFDICTLFNWKCLDPDIDREKFIGKLPDGKKHNAMYDAVVIKRCYDKLACLK